MRTGPPAAPPARLRQRCTDVPLEIGLVNNMPDAALRATERQFRDLLAAAGGGGIRLRLFCLPAVPRGADGHAHIEQYYEDAGRLAGTRLDGLIVTGNEPKAARFSDEPYWPELARLIDWAEDNTISTVWSCLAAHAAVFHLDGIDRRRFGDKLFGLFDCDKTAKHQILARAPPRWRVPHSRWNEVPEAALAANGYRVLARSASAGADFFVRERNSLFIFFQGHPEYDPGALAREYRRDVGRFLAGTAERYPQLPHGYFDAETAAVLARFRESALCRREPGLMADFPPIAPPPATGSSPGPGVWIYANWLRLLAERKERPTTAEDHPTAQPEAVAL